MDTSDRILGVVLGAALGLFLSLLVTGDMLKNATNRALSCMATGNTVEQCKDILGVK